MLYAVPIKRAEAKRYVALLHRHHVPSLGAVFCVACCDETGVVRGVAMVGRPVARNSDDGFTLEVTRVATDGVRNGCSFLYGFARRAAFTLGYRRLLTFTLPQEGGASLRASGWRLDGDTAGGTWSRPSRQREDNAPLCAKLRWVILNPKAYPGRRRFELLERESRQADLFGGE